MQLCVVIPSEAFAASAGVRIRYRRLATVLQPMGITLTIVPVDKLASRAALVHDAYVFCKVFSPRAFLLARRVQDLGKLTGMDLFDNYFTQEPNMRLAMYRNWMREAAARLDFCLCSTPNMRLVLRAFTPDMPALVLPDPAPEFDVIRLAHLLRVKQARRSAGGPLRIVWFGIGDNPYFQVGVQDLVAFSGTLARLRRATSRPLELRLVTNHRALTADALAALRGLPVAPRIEEWSEALETSALEEADIAFVPVNYQAFSAAKSLNRAVTALISGSMVLTAGYPLYEALGDVVTDDVEALLAVLEDDSPAMPRRWTAQIIEGLVATSNVWTGGAELAAFLRGLRGRPPAAVPPAHGLAGHARILRSKSGFPPDLAVLHGAEADGGSHKMVRQLGGLSLSSPFNAARLNFDARIDFTWGDAPPLILVEQGIHDSIVPPALRPLFRPHGAILEKPFLVYAEPQRFAHFPVLNLPRETLESGRPGFEAAFYSPAMQASRAIFQQIFPGTDILIGERRPLSMPPLSLAPDSLVPDSLAPDSLAPDSLAPDAAQAPAA